MKTHWTFDELADEISRMIGECGDEYHDPAPHTLREKAAWLLAADDPPIDDDAEICDAIVADMLRISN